MLLIGFSVEFAVVGTAYAVGLFVVVWHFVAFERLCYVLRQFTFVERVF